MKNMLIEEYEWSLRVERAVSAGTVRLRLIHIRMLARDRDLLTATTATLHAWIIERAARANWAPKTINTVIESVRSFYRWAHAAGHLRHDPAASLHRVRAPERPARIATAAEIAAGLASDDPWTRAATRLGAECGLRVHEIAKLHTDDRDGEWLTVFGKGGQTRVVHVAAELALELDTLEASQGAGFYFRNRSGAHLTPDSIRRRIKRTLGTNPHSLRHRAGTTVFRHTKDLRVTQVFLGHSSPTTTARYVHVERDDLLAASDAARIATKDLAAA